MASSDKTEKTRTPSSESDVARQADSKLGDPKQDAKGGMKSYLVRFGTWYRSVCSHF